MAPIEGLWSLWSVKNEGNANYQMLISYCCFVHTFSTEFQYFSFLFAGIFLELSVLYIICNLIRYMHVCVYVSFADRVCLSVLFTSQTLDYIKGG